MHKLRKPLRYTPSPGSWLRAGRAMRGDNRATDVEKALRGEKGITGLETAIILIAFVVVAAVFAYTVLSAGLFATQKASESVYSGLEEARSALEIKGGVVSKAYAIDDCDYPRGWMNSTENWTLNGLAGEANTTFSRNTTVANVTSASFGKYCLQIDSEAAQDVG